MKSRSGSVNFNALLECTDLVPAFSRFGRLSLSLASGEMLCLSGPSGIGKSSLLCALAGLKNPIHGTMRCLGFEMAPLGTARFKRSPSGAIYLVPQSLPLVSQLDVFDNVLFSSRFRGNCVSGEECRDLLVSIGLQDRLHFLPAQLSVGEKQRVSVARGLLSRASILLIDEPTSNLDPESVSLILRVFREATKIGRALLLVSNDPRLTAFSDRVLILDSAGEYEGPFHSY